MDKTNVKRQLRFRERMREAGFKLMQLWAHPADWPAIKRYADRLRKRRTTDGSGGGQ